MGELGVVYLHARGVGKKQASTALREVGSVIMKNLVLGLGFRGVG